MMPDASAFQRLTVRLSLGILACGMVDGGMVWANQDALTSSSHEPTMALFVHLATTLLMCLSGLIFLLRDWVKRHHPRAAGAAQAEHSTLEQAVTRLALVQTEQQRDISALRGQLDDFKTDIVATLHEELKQVRETVTKALSETTAVVAVAKAQLGRLEEAENGAKVKKGGRS